MSPDADPTAFFATDAAKGHAQLLVRDMTPFQVPPGVINSIPPIFSPNGSRLLCVATSNKGNILICDGRAGQPCEAYGQPVFSLDSRHLAYTAKREGGWVLVCDDSLSAPCDEIGRPVFSPDSKHVVAVAKRQGSSFVICDAKESPAYGEIDSIRFTGDSRHLFFRVHSGDKWMIVVDGVPAPEHQALYIPEACNSGSVCANRYLGTSAEGVRPLRYVTVDAGQVSLVDLPYPKTTNFSNNLVSAPKR